MRHALAAIEASGPGHYSPSLGRASPPNKKSGRTSAPRLPQALHAKRGSRSESWDVIAPSVCLIAIARCRSAKGRKAISIGRYRLDRCNRLRSAPDQIKDQTTRQSATTATTAAVPPAKRMMSAYSGAASDIL
jgi:hypothetical protein